LGVLGIKQASRKGDEKEKKEAFTSSGLPIMVLPLHTPDYSPISRK
jgi:hypothetical protein